MKLTITGFDQNTGLLAYTSQEVVYGPLSRTYSLRPPVVGFIEQARAHEVGSIVASVSIISAQYEALSEAERIIGRLYCELYKGDLTDLVGIDYTTGVSGLKPAVELPTTADLDYINKNAGPVWKAQGDANEYVLLDEIGHWIASIKLNGEMSVAVQEEFLNRYFGRG